MKGVLFRSLNNLLNRRLAGVGVKRHFRVIESMPLRREQRKYRLLPQEAGRPPLHSTPLSAPRVHTGTQNLANPSPSCFLIKREVGPVEQLIEPPPATNVQKEAGIDLGFIDIAFPAKAIHHSRDERHTDGLWNFTFCAHLAVKGSRRMKKSPEG
jgi:hypothetical protein